MENLESSLDVISRKKICSELGISRDTLRNWVQGRNFPKPLKLPVRQPIWKLSEVKNWLREGV
jgi:predicted DNA-binding transcriptional regulator AlpA